jgi:hypothetical protein
VSDVQGMTIREIGKPGAIPGVHVVHATGNDALSKARSVHAMQEFAVRRLLDPRYGRLVHAP